MTGPAFRDVVRELLSAGTPVSFRATGSSMMPTIRDGEVVTILPATLAEPGRGQVVLYDDGVALRAHRILRIGRGRCIVRGDAPGFGEEAISRQQIHGILVSIDRNGRSVEARKSLRSRVAGFRLRARRAAGVVLSLVGAASLVRTPR